MWVLLAVCGIGAISHLTSREPGPVEQSVGVLAPDAPTQQTLSGKLGPIAIGRFLLQPLAQFRTEARVLSRKRYDWDDESELSPLDFALGWGRMSDSAVLAQLQIEQSVRFFSYRWTGRAPIPPDEIVVSATNVHLIPADAGVLNALERVRAGQVVRLSGLLVKAERADGWSWNSSLTRADTGAGACELLLVRDVAILNLGGS